MSEPVVLTEAGRVRGSAGAHGLFFRGIPFARAPFGDLRFRAPAPVEPWEGERPALHSAPTAPQPATGFTLIPEPTIDGGEAPECLSLNVFTPELGAAGLPVLVWIHGGGFVTGTPSSTWYDGDRFARDGVVVVSAGYRLGAEGFLEIPGAQPNRAVLDWIAALEWVQANIAAFGGDPAKVTVGGQSAGGAATMLLTTLPRAQGLFRSAIPMSGSVFPAPSSEAVAELRAKVAAELGVEATLEGFSRVPPSKLVEAQTAATAAPEGSAAERFGRGLSFSPVIDGDVVPEPPMKAIASGAGSACRVLIGTTAEEVTALARMSKPDEAVAERALRSLGLDDAGAAAYRVAYPDPGTRLGQAATDRTFRLPAWRVAEARAGAGAATYHYQFDWRTQALGGLGAVHCLDLPFVFDVLDDEHARVVAGDDPPQPLADQMHDAWAAFITDGDPGWPRFGPGRRPTMVFSGASEVVGDLLEETRSRWP